jgi:arabinofuranosyltransferase
LLAARGRDLATWLPPLALALLVLVASPRSPLRVGTSAYAEPRVSRPGDHVIDTRAYVLREGAALLNYAPGVALPHHAAYLAGLRFREAPERVHVGGPGPRLGPMVGYSGYTSGPGKHIIDLLGLTDPLLARMPIGTNAGWRPGHFFRALPAGYRESIEQRANLVRDPDLHAYYDVLLEITRGPLFSGHRMVAIWRLNTGTYDPLLAAYAHRNNLRW